MASRFVYSPKVWAYVKRDDGEVLDLTRYLTAGSITRRLDAVSSAQLSLRNPHRMWTNYEGIKANPAFRPMDPIQIYMQRHDTPMQVFTGYLDRTPYYQLYPGVVTLYASCTLKRLQYTFFDAGLPYMWEFLSKYGWLPNKATGTIMNVKAEVKDLKDTKFFTDSGIGSLLHGTLHHIGKWSVNDMYIEQLPTGITGQLTKAFHSFEASNDQAVKEYESLWSKFIDAGGISESSGGGGGGGGGDPDFEGSKNVEIAFNYMRDKGFTENQAAGAVGSMMQESGISLGPTAENPSSGAYGIAQWLGGRLTTLRNRPNPSTLETQLRYVWEELKGSEGSAYSKMKAANTIEEAVDVWTIYYERPGPAERVLETRYGYARNVYNEYANQPRNTSSNADNDPSASTSSSSSPTATTSSSASDSDRLAAIKREAEKIHNAQYTYVYGGGHNADFAPTNNGYDCSGSVSRVFHAAGLLDSPLTSGAFMSWGESGPGRVTVFANPGHMFISIDGRCWGTSANTGGNPNLPGGRGPGWLPTPSEEYMNGFTKRHPRGLGGDPNLNPGENRRSTSTFDLNLNPINAVTTVGTAGPRSGKPKVIIIHDTEGHNQPGDSDMHSVANYLKSVGLSIHIVNDAEGGCLRMVEDNVIAQHVREANDFTLGIEQIGFASQASWPAKQIDNTAKWVAFWADKYDIPITISTTHGVHSHNGMPGNDRTDPGPNYPMREMLDKASDYLGRIGEGGGSGGDDGGQPTAGGAAAFAASVVLPGLADTEASLLLQGEKSLMNDKPLLPFIQQLASASLRRFQSLPDGRFFAFYADYFGEFAKDTLPYWEIDDVEILDGTIELTDENVVTHEYVVGETIPFINDSVPLYAMLRSAGVVTIFNAFGNDAESAPGFIKSYGELQGPDAAISFLSRYGVRPELFPAPMIRSPYFELLLAWQRFMLSWSQQFLTEFTFTFMPELYPGGRIGFKQHGIQCFVEEVTHTFDFATGFTTSATISAASAYGKDNPELKANLVSNPFSKTTVDG